eukprot:5754227-Prymnesium_polylepis.1
MPSSQSITGSSTISLAQAPARKSKSAPVKITRLSQLWERMSDFSQATRSWLAALVVADSIADDARPFAVSDCPASSCPASCPAS